MPRGRQIDAEAEAARTAMGGSGSALSREALSEYQVPGHRDHRHRGGGDRVRDGAGARPWVADGAAAGREVPRGQGPPAAGVPRGARRCPALTRALPAGADVPEQAGDPAVSTAAGRGPTGGAAGTSGVPLGAHGGGLPLPWGCGGPRPCCGAALPLRSRSTPGRSREVPSPGRAAGKGLWALPVAPGGGLARGTLQGWVLAAERVLLQRLLFPL